MAFRPNRFRNFHVTQTSRIADGNGQYDVKNLTFPMDLFGTPDRYGGCWCMININVLASSSALTTGGYETVNIGENDRKVFTEYADRVKNNGDDTAGKAAASVAAVGFLKTVVSGSSPSVRDVVGTTVGTGIALAPLLTENRRETKRIKSAIQLPMPNRLVSSYGANWSQENTAIFDMMQRFPGMTMEAFTPSAKGTFSQLGTAAMDAVVGTSLAGQGLLGGGGMSSATGLASNPKKEMIFDGVNFRQFVLEYDLYPRSEEEASNVQDIIYELKYHMHPEYKSESRYTYIYPSEFDITFFNKSGAENLWVSRIATSVLTDLSVDYTPNGLWVAKDGEGLDGGHPNMMKLSLTFKELSLHTKDTINKGF